MCAVASLKGFFNVTGTHFLNIRTFCICQAEFCSYVYDTLSTKFQPDFSYSTCSFMRIFTVFLPIYGDSTLNSTKYSKTSQGLPENFLDFLQ